MNFGLRVDPRDLVALVAGLPATQAYPQPFDHNSETQDYGGLRGAAGGHAADEGQREHGQINETRNAECRPKSPKT